MVPSKFRFTTETHLPAGRQGEHGGNCLMIQSGLRHAVAASAAQAGDGDWIRNSFPSGLRSIFFNGYVSYYELGIRTRGTFLFGGEMPPNKKVLLRGLGVSAVNTLFGTRMKLW